MKMSRLMMPVLTMPVLMMPLLGSAGLLLSASVARAQSTSDKPISAVPPAGSGHSTTAQAPAGGPAPTSTIKVPGPAYNAGTANVGNSSEGNGIQGSQGAGASATMQSGHTGNR